MHYRILYVEDEQILGQLVKESLEKLNYEVLKITNGVDALKAYRDFKPHLCLLDIMLPGKDGYDVARQIRALDTKIPILFLTAKVQVNDVITGFNTGCNDYIRKPFSIDELAARINSWLSEKYGKADTEDKTKYTAGGYSFLPGKQLLITPNETITLTYKESVVLHMLFAHRNKVISRDHLQQKVWGTDTIYNSRTLDVYINRLRKYFGDSQNKILTLKGVGYKLITE
jgi:DNA-binding response OmpR family regulator